MNVTIQYTAQAKLFAGRASEDLEVADNTKLVQLIQIVAARDNAELRNLLVTQDGRPRQSYLVFIGDRCVRGFAEEVLRDGDRVTIMSMISGG